jgi:hypothetical protein
VRASWPPPWKMYAADTVTNGLTKSGELRSVDTITKDTDDDTTLQVVNDMLAEPHLLGYVLVLLAAK